MGVVCAGEAMLELVREGDLWRMGYGGDTLNTAIHLARAGHQTAYLTALGADSFSEWLRSRWEAEGLDCSLVLTHPKRGPGLYAIETDASGERSFAYWRDDSAAREMLDLPTSEAALNVAQGANLLAFSLITLAVLPPRGRERLLVAARAVRANGGRVAFDGNYRPRLWQDAGEAIAARDAAIAVSDIGLPTLDDESALCGAVSADAVALHWQQLGCAEVVVKLGVAGCRLPDGELIAPGRTLAPVDTSGAGDAFNAGYLGARLSGVAIAGAAHAGHALAAWAIMRPGAIPPRDG